MRQLAQVLKWLMMISAGRMKQTQAHGRLQMILLVPANND